MNKRLARRGRKVTSMMVMKGRLGWRLLHIPIHHLPGLASLKGQSQ
jgi:hypothetical protein